MATYTTGSYTWKLGNFTLENKKFPIAVIEVDFGVPLVSGDIIDSSFWNYAKHGLFGAVTLCRISGQNTFLQDIYPQFVHTGTTVIASDGGPHNLGFTATSSPPWLTWDPVWRYNNGVARYLFTNSSVADLAVSPCYMVHDVQSGSWIRAIGNAGCYIYGRVNYPSTDPFGIIDINGLPVGFIDENSAEYTVGSGESNMVVGITPEWDTLFNEIIDLRISTDPYFAGGNTEPGGGTGDFDGSSDPVDIPSLPATGATNTGFITVYNPSLAQLNSLAVYMWANPLFDVSAWKKIFADPMDAILGLTIVPVAIPSGGTRAVSVGNIPTDVNMTIAGSQYVEVNCGSINVNEYWGGYLDYSPYTKAEIYLPYVGTHAIAVDDIMGKTVTVRYHVDILSGACVAYVKCGESVLYSYIGQCASSIPVNGRDLTSIVNGALNIAGAVGSMVATGGASAPMIASVASSAVNIIKPEVQKSGAISGTGGFMAIQKPYIILTRPRQALPFDQNKFMGYPSFVTMLLGDVEGYTEVESVHLENIPCTSTEMSEIETLLKAGVIF